MGGSAYTARGASTGQAPTTVFFGPVPDKYTMLLPYYSFNNGVTHGVQFVKMISAVNINTWVPWNDQWALGGAGNITASITGPAVTAPDGTSTAHHVTEGTNTGLHVMVAGSTDYNLLNTPARRRFAIFAKAAERTRCWLQVGSHLGVTGNSNQYEAGVRCVFDLAGGQIGVPVGTNNTGPFPLNYSAIGAGIIPYGNGWYLCYIDASLALGASPFLGSGCLQAIFGPDSGSGTGAISNSYAGDGSSGVYAWKASMLPPRCFGMNSISYFSDFTSISEIDVNNTLAQGYKWYVAGATWPGITYFGGISGVTPGWLTPIAPTTLTVSGSVMTVPSAIVAGTNPTTPNVTTAAYNNAGGYVGTVFAPPWLMEWKGHFEYSTSVRGDNVGELSWWSVQLEYIINAGNNNATAWDYQEDDFMDSGVAGGTYEPLSALLDCATLPFTGPPHQTSEDFQTSPVTGYPLWSQFFPYANGNAVAFNGVLYVSLTGVGNLNKQPDISPAFWSIFTPSAPSPPAVADNVIIDFNVDHIWTHMRITDRSLYSPFDDCGEIINFFDGLYTLNSGLAPSIAYGAHVGPNNRQSLSQSRDRYHSLVIFGSSQDRAMFVDYMRVYQ